ncbi:MAG: glycosyltransferase, partial [Syntrophales bacterium]|nr:glycosyltransferase [Syntrophales bacterium]
VGDGPLRQDLERRASHMDMGGRARVCPARRDLAGMLSAIDILIIASRSESVPLLLYDTMAMARPLVATAVGGIPEVLEDGKTGLVVPPEDAAALAAAIEHLLASPAMADAMGQRARTRILERYAIENCVREIQQIYQDLTGVST